MVDIVRIPARFTQVYKTIDGHRFYGRMMKVSDSNPSSVTLQKRLLKVSPRSFVRPGMLVYDLDGKLYMTADGSTAMTDQRNITRSMKLILADRHFRWERPMVINDPVTGVPRGSGFDQLGFIWANFAPAAERMERTSKMTVNYEKWTLITTSPVQIKDRIDGRLVVERSELVGGVYVADVQ